MSRGWRRRRIHKYHMVQCIGYTASVAAILQVLLLVSYRIVGMGNVVQKSQSNVFGV